MPRINSDEALSLVRRLSALKGYPFHGEAEARLVRVLLDSGADPPRALAAVDTFDDTCPSPGQLQRAVQDVLGPRRLSVTEFKSIVAVNEEWLRAFPAHPQAPAIRAETEAYRRDLGMGRKDGAA